ncbi:MAG TPA: hypothetical protein DF383_04815, partial [Deltaproteobacteria bacterium]|nr:hypothetical protein [Deltaproteobacteria bacterium]
GNGIVTAGEQCDDGNLIDGDGCESDCTLTPLTTPSPTPSSQPVVDPPVSNGGLSGGGSCSLGLTETPKGMARSFLLLVGITLSMLALFGRRGLRKE